MAIPLLPIASVTLKYGLVALAGAAVARSAVKKKSEKDAFREAAFNNVDEGLEMTKVQNEHETQVEGSFGTWRRVWFLNRGIEIDTRVLGRLRVRKLNKDE